MITRPLGASFADWLAVPHERGGLGFGTGPVSTVLFGVFLLLVIALVVRERLRRTAAQQARALR